MVGCTFDSLFESFMNIYPFTAPLEPTPEVPAAVAGLIIALFI